MEDTHVLSKKLIEVINDKEGLEALFELQKADLNLTMSKQGPIPQDQALIMLEDHYDDLLEIGDSLIGSLGLKHGILNAKMLKRTGAFTDPSTGRRAVFSQHKFDTIESAYRQVHIWRYKILVIALADLLINKLPVRAIKEIKFAYSSDGRTLRIRKWKLKDTTSLEHFAEILNFIREGAKLADAAYLVKVFGHQRPQEFHLGTFATKTNKCYGFPNIKRMLHIISGRPIPMVKGKRPSRPQATYLKAQKEIDVVLTGLNGHPSLLEMITEAVAQACVCSKPATSYFGNVSREFWRALVGECLQSNQHIIQDRILELYCFATDQINSLINSRSAPLWLENFNVEETLANSLFKMFNAILKDVRGYGMKFVVDTHDDCELGLDLAKFADLPRIPWHNEHLLSVLLEYITKRKMRTIVQHGISINSITSQYFPLTISSEITHIMGDDGSYFRDLGRIGQADGKWIADELRVKEVVAPNSPDNGKLVTIWISNKPAQTRSGELKIAAKHRFYRIINDLRKLINKMRQKEEFIITDRNLQARAYDKLWTYLGKGSNRLTNEGENLLLRLTAAYETGDVIGEYGLVRWVGFGHSNRLYHETRRGWKWYEPDQLYIAFQSFQPQGHMFRDYLQQLRTLENGRIRHLVADLETEVRELDRKLMKIKASSLSRRFLWLREEAKYMSKDESLLLQLRDVYKRLSMQIQQAKAISDD
ncbi:MAG: hypothetical protein ACXACI_14290 [Candidatus Hodarchaeales archaeon]|jgi:hypothetical protein